MQSEVEAAHAEAACWVCGAVGAAPYKPSSLDRSLRPEDLKISDAHYGRTLALRRCVACGFVFADGDELARLVELYAALDDPGYEESLGPRRLQMRWLLELALRARPDARSALDVGAGAGLLVGLARERGLDATGVEPSAKLVEAAARAGIPLLQGTLPHPELAGRRFDVVFVVDVIEHVRDPVGMLAQARARLAPGGVAVVVTPDLASLARRALGLRWWHFRLAHVGYFDEASFGRAASRAGLGVAHKARAKWFFEAGYLVERLGRYLPIGALLRAAQATALGRRASQVVVPLNLHDSWVFVLQEAA